jgi:hypothetical protein
MQETERIGRAAPGGWNLCESGSENLCVRSWRVQIRSRARKPTTGPRSKPGTGPAAVLGYNEAMFTSRWYSCPLERDEVGQNAIENESRGINRRVTVRIQSSEECCGAVLDSIALG